MRVLTVGSLPPEWGGPVRGGVATFHAALLTGLLDREDVEVVGVLPPAALNREIAPPVFVRPTDVGRAAFYEELLERLRPDVVLMNHIANTVGVTHARLLSPPPVVGVVHSWHNVTFRSGEERAQAMALTAEALTGMAAVVVPSAHALAEGRELGFSYPTLIEAIPSPLPSHLAEDVDVSQGERHGVIYIGSLIARKSPAALVQAAACLPATHFLLVGEGELKPDLRILIERLALIDRVELAGALSGPDHLRRVRELLLGASVLCLPSSSESFGLVLIEALACGTPVVGFGPAVREIRDAMGIEIGEPLDTGAPEEIAAAIERVAAVRWDRELLRRAALDTFGLSRIVDRYVRLLRRVAPEPALEGP
jgi:glycosyltransferase involved in cell wall biosynthesis